MRSFAVICLVSMLALCMAVLCIVAPALAAFPPPVADFRANETDICVFDYVQFTDESTYYGSPTWQWEVTDPLTTTTWGSFDENPVHQFDTVGTYNVFLIVQDAWGTGNELKTGYIVVRDCYTADFWANKTCDIGAPRVVSLNGTCSSPLGKTVWHIDPNESFSYWDGTNWIDDLDGVWTGDDSGDLNATVNFTGFGAYTITHSCQYAPPVGAYTETKTDYILIGVNGTYCSGGSCSSGMVPTDWLSVAVVLSFVPIWGLILFARTKN